MRLASVNKNGGCFRILLRIALYRACCRFDDDGFIQDEILPRGRME